MKLQNIILTACLTAVTVAGYAQNKTDKAPENWFNLDYAKDGVRGVSSEKAYEEFLKGKKSKTIIVSIIDSGMDEEHEDLKEVMWVNKGEKPGNGLDDDGNGYIDDIHGWNFIGNKEGKSVNQDALEMTRLYAYLNGKKRNKKEEERYQEIKKDLDKQNNSIAEKIKFYETIIGSLETLDEAINDSIFTFNSLSELKENTKEEKVKTAVRFFQNMFFPQLAMSGIEKTDSIAPKKLVKQFNGALSYYQGQKNYYYNPEFDPRKELVGDDYYNTKEKYYGNNDVTGLNAEHGTHVGGIVGAKRKNGIGMDGVANDVALMSVRVVPDGDERDKDVANAIYYSVDNGAKIINMSFGKGFSFNKKIVDKAVKYAERKGVLLVHASGNSNLNTDKSANYPNKYCKDKRNKKPFSNWIEVGALSWKDSAAAPATFSNYGAQNVDIFAPGVAIYSTVPGSKYDSYNGTSMASPVVAGVAALVWSYYPELSVKELRKVLTESAIKISDFVNVPGSGGKKQVEFKELCNTGGVINAYEALKMAEKIVAAKKK